MRRFLRTLKIGAVIAALVVGTLAAVIGLWVAGYISRPVTSALSPDGRIEAVCRGRLPESTEYDLWLRRPTTIFGRRLGHVGTETRGRCRAVVWSPDGGTVAVLTDAGFVGVFDGRSGRPVGYDTNPALEYRDPEPQLIAAVHLESRDAIVIERCQRLWDTTGRLEDMSRCGAATTAERIALRLQPPRGFFGR